MKSNMRKIATLLLVVALMLSVIPAQQADAASGIYYSKKVTKYLGTDWNDQGYLTISNMTTKQKVTSVKSSDTSVVEIITVGKYKNVSTTIKANASEGEKKGKSSYADATIIYKGKKPGKSVISFKIGSKTYKSTITVKKRPNALKSVKITGINGGKDLASALNKSADCYINIKSNDVKKAKLSVTAAKGWKVTSVEFTNNTSRYYKGYYYIPKTTKSLTFGKLIKEDYYHVYITCEDANHNTISYTIYLDSNYDASIY